MKAVEDIRSNLEWFEVEFVILLVGIDSGSLFTGFSSEDESREFVSERTPYWLVVAGSDHVVANHN